MKRRTFLQRGAMGLLGATAATRLGPGAARGDEAGDSPVRVGVIGVGGEATRPGTQRGQQLMRVMLNFPGVEVTAICDVVEANANEAVELVRQMGGREPAVYGDGPEDYRNLLEREDVDAVLIATPAQTHARMSIDAMRAGKDVGSEVPGGYTLEELEELVAVREETGRHYMLLENYNYRENDLLLYNMAQRGALGELYYANCRYIHELKYIAFHPDGSPTWRNEWFRSYRGDYYPTHAIGPVAKWLGILEGDAFDYCVSTLTDAGVMNQYVRQTYGPESEQAQVDYAAGELTTTLIHTKQGRVIRTEFDVVSNRPHEFHGFLQGTQRACDTNGLGITDEDRSEHAHGYWTRDGEAAAQTGHGGADYFVMRDFVEMVRQGREPWIDVYDSATWSAIYECSRRSIEQGGEPVPFPDFTNGRWSNPEWRSGNMTPA